MDPTDHASTSRDEALDPGAVAALRSAVGSGALITDPERSLQWRVDWSGTEAPAGAVVALPGTVREVAEVIACCAAHAVPVTVQGGNTGLVGGSIPDRPGVILSTQRLRGLFDFDRREGAITAESGVTLAELEARLGGSGWRFGVDLASRDRATVGGTIASNAGGTRVFRHGTTRDQVAGAQFVDAGGRVIDRLGGLRKDNSGYDLVSLLSGSEGTLGIITAARLRLVADPVGITTALVGFDTVGAAVDGAWTLRREVASVEVAELISADCLQLVAHESGRSVPVPGEAALLVEARRDPDPFRDVAAAIDCLPGVTGAAVASDPPTRASLWSFRDRISDAVGRLGNLCRFDVSVPGSAVMQTIAGVQALVAGHDDAARLWVFGHVCDHNLHLNATGVGRDRVADLEDEVTAFVVALGGTFSAEHGIGRTRRRHLPSYRSPADIEVMRAVKHAVDPGGLLNPGVIFPG